MGNDQTQQVRNIELHIDELVLHGFGWLDRSELGAAVERALARLFAERGVPASLNRNDKVERLDTATVRAQPEAGVHELGGQIAQAIYRSFGS